MRAPLGLPAAIRTDASNAFAHHTMAVRVPAIFESVIRQNPDYTPRVRARLQALQAALTNDAPLPEIDPDAPHADGWLGARARRAGESWLGTDWFFAENYLYRQLVDATGYFENGRDPFLPTKREEYRSAAHQAAFEAALRLDATGDAGLASLLLASLFGNRIDLSFAPSREHGVHVSTADLLIDERKPALGELLRGSGPIQLVLDNSGTELSVDLVLAWRLLQELGTRVVLHVKVHPCFVSDTVEADIAWFLAGSDAEARALWAASSAIAHDCRRDLQAARDDGRLEVAAHSFWNGPLPLWELPSDLAACFAEARLVILKGDAHYRRAVGDALWPAESSFAAITSSFPAPLLALRTLKSDAIVGLRPGLSNELDQLDARWRVNGRRGVASFGGAAPAR
ncbi:MAG TPA: ARMT1-like domain-containing protein [Polyangiaceae bacterium]|nr:ARMT1-like domain-containing protein [Polyangiaceae bacterium]